MRKLFLGFGLLLAMASNAQDSMNVKLLYHWKVDSLPISSAHGNAYNEVWGFVQDNEEYAVIGTTMGTHIFWLDSPDSTKEVVFIPGKSQGAHIIHRDYHDYNGYLYMVCDEGASSLQIADLSFLPDSAPLVYDSNSLFVNSHNIFIDSATAKLYVCGGENQLNVYSLANPTNPTLLVDCQDSVSYWEATIGGLHDIYVRNDTAYCNAANRGFFVVDFSDTDDPVVLGSLTEYPYKGYNHSGWLNQSGTVYALADENHGYKIKMLDVTDLTDINLIDTISSGVDSLSIPHNQIFKDNFLFVSYYQDGVYIFNANNLNQIYISGYYDTSTEEHATNYRGCWGVYPLLPSGRLLASDMQNGLFVLDVADALTGVKEGEEENSIVIFPNPTGNTFNISLPNPRDYSSYSVIDITGRKISEGTISNTITSVSLPEKSSKGVYFIQLTGQNKIITKRVVKAY